MSDDSMSVDVLIVGAGPAGLSAAIRLKQLALEQKKEVSVVVLEKGAEVGAHILSGAVFDPRALKTLFPDYESRDTPLRVPVTEDRFYYLTAQHSRRLPIPPSLKNKGHYIISLGELCTYLSQEAEKLGVEIYAGFTGKTILYEDDRVVGVASGEMGVNKLGDKKTGYQPPFQILAKHVFMAEGARGYLSEQIISKYQLRQTHQTYALGLKEIWEVDASVHQQGLVIHSLNYPLDKQTYGGGFAYHWDKNRVLVGFVAGLDYKNPYFSPFEAFQAFKRHPLLQGTLKTGRCLKYGARTLNEGGWQSLPQLTFPGGMILGCSAGWLNVPRIKGSHLAMQSGIQAAESMMSASDYNQDMKGSWAGKELYQARNIRPSFKWGIHIGMAYAALDTIIFRQRTPWTLSHGVSDDKALKPAKYFTATKNQKADGKITFDRLVSVNHSNTFHEEDQPCHLIVKDEGLFHDQNMKTYDGPETRYCPAAVYEYVTVNGERQLQINAANCLHCKACDIKDPNQNIQWTPPEGGGGPQYTDM